MNLTWVDDPTAEPGLEPYGNLKDREIARRLGLFLLEGRSTLDSFLSRGRFPLVSVMVSRRRVGPDLDLLERIPDGVPIYVVDQEVMDRVTGFNVHRGLLAAGKRPAPTPPGEFLDGLSEGMSTVLVLEGLTNHDNTGACFRNAAGLGADGILLDDRCCDPLYRKSIRVSAGHVLGLPFSHGYPMSGILDELEARGYVTAALTPSADATELVCGARPGDKVAILLGTEGPGLTRETMERASLRVEIPMAPGVDSLNVATAGAIALFAWAR